ncbi:MAG: hypothetical protein ACFFEN_09790 [Candidatus Thorarchaeota archaeon]
MGSELEELKELSIAKIKVAYNRSIDLEATHSILWSRSDRSNKIRLLVTLVLSIFAAILITFSLVLSINLEFWWFILLADIFTIIIMVIVICESITMFTKRSGAHGHIVNDALQLREQSMSFLQYKLDNLDREGYINELKSLEIQDFNVKKKSEKFTSHYSKKIKRAIHLKIKDLEKQGTKKYFITQEETDSATEKLQKYSILRTVKLR